MKLKSKLKLYEEFVNESKESIDSVSVDQVTVDATNASDAIRTEVIRDVDTILDTLAELSDRIGESASIDLEIDELYEELFDLTNVSELNEGILDFIKSPIKFMKIKKNLKAYQKALVQKAINDVDFAKKKQVGDADEKDKKRMETLKQANQAKNKALDDQLSAISERMTELSSGDEGLGKVVSIGKTKSKLAAAQIVMKATSGEEAKQLKLQIDTLSDRIAADEKSLKDYAKKQEPAEKSTDDNSGDEDNAASKNQLSGLGGDDKAAADKATADKAAADKAAADKAAADKAAADKAAADKATADKAAADKAAADKATADKAAADKAAADKAAADKATADKAAADKAAADKATADKAAADKAAADKAAADKAAADKTPETDTEKLDAAVTKAQEAKDKLPEDASKQDKAKADITLFTAKIAVAKAKGEDTKDLEGKLEAAKNTAALKPVQVSGGVTEEGLEIDLSFEASLVEASLNGLMAYDADEDDYGYLKQQAKKLGVKVSVDKDPFGDGYDELNYSGDKSAILKLAAISGHDQDITSGPEEGGYWIEESVKEEMPKTIKLDESMSIADRFKALM